MRLLKVEPDRAKGWLILLSLLRPLLPPLPVKTAAPPAVRAFHHGAPHRALNTVPYRQHYAALHHHSGSLSYRLYKIVLQ